MNDKLQYASMLEIPVNTCSITYKPARKRRFIKKRSPEEVKAELLNKVNATAEQEQQSQPEEIICETVNNPQKKGFKSKIVGIELAIVGVLIATILLTNVFYKNSSMNTLFNGVINNSASSSVVDSRTYAEFKPVIAVDNEIVPEISEGVITLSNSGSVYSSVEGEICNVIIDENSKYTVEIAHSETFKSRISGLDYLYAEVGDKVYGNIPVGYVESENYSMCFYDGEDILTDFSLENGQVNFVV